MPVTEGRCPRVTKQMLQPDVLQLFGWKSAATITSVSASMSTDWSPSIRIPLCNVQMPRTNLRIIYREGGFTITINRTRVDVAWISGEWSSRTDVSQGSTPKAGACNRNRLSLTDTFLSQAWLSGQMSLSLIFHKCIVLSMVLIINWASIFFFLKKNAIFLFMYEIWELHKMYFDRIYSLPPNCLLTVPRPTLPCHRLFFFYFFFNYYSYMHTYI